MWDALEPLDDRTLRRLRWAADVQFYVVALFLLMVLARQAASPYVLALYQHALVLGKQAEQLGPQRVEVDPTDPQADQSERTDDGWKAFKTTDAPFDRKAWVAKLDEYGDAVDRCIVVGQGYQAAWAIGVLLSLPLLISVYLGTPTHLGYERERTRLRVAALLLVPAAIAYAAAMFGNVGKHLGAGTLALLVAPYIVLVLTTLILTPQWIRRVAPIAWPPMTFSPGVGLVLALSVAVAFNYLQPQVPRPILRAFAAAACSLLEIACVWTYFSDCRRLSVTLQIWQHPPQDTGNPRPNDD